MLVKDYLEVRIGYAEADVWIRVPFECSNRIIRK